MDNLSPDHPKPRSRNWGGRCPGAGAKKGTLNAFRHGRYSTQQARDDRMLASIPEAQDALTRIARRRRKREKEIEHGASALIGEIFRRLGESVLKPQDNHLELDRDIMAHLRLPAGAMEEKPESNQDRHLNNQVRGAKGCRLLLAD